MTDYRPSSLWDDLPEVSMTPEQEAALFRCMREGIDRIIEAYWPAPAPTVYPEKPTCQGIINMDQL